MTNDTMLDGPIKLDPGQGGDEPAAPDPQRWIALAVVLIAGFIDLLDTTIVNVALPSIQHDLHAQYADLEWVVAGYALAFAAVLITGGRLGDIFGRKRLFLLGVGGFTVASLLAGVANNATVLIGSRVLEGAMAALMVPQILAIIHVTFPQSERGKVFGLYGGIIGSASVAGPILGGLLVQANVVGLSWRPIFLINIPVGAVAIIAGKRYIRESRSPSAPRLDLLGMGIAIVAIAVLIYPLAEGRTQGWPVWIFVTLACSVPLFAIFVAYEQRRTRTIGSPLVVLRLFKERTFDAGLGVWLLFNIALGGFFLVWTLYMQIGLGWTPLHAGLTSVAFALGAAPAAAISVQVLTPRFGRKVLMAGALLNAAGFGLYIWQTTVHGTSISSWNMIIPLIAAGAGFGFVVAPITDLVISGVPQDDAGSASGLFNTTQQLGMALGVALVGLLFFTQVAGHANTSAGHEVSALRDQLAAVQVPTAAQQQLIAGYQTCLHDRSAAKDPTSTPPSCATLEAEARQVSPQAAGPVSHALQQRSVKANGSNFSWSFDVTLVAEAGILILVFLGMFSLPRKVRDDDPNTAAAGS